MTLAPSPASVSGGISRPKPPPAPTTMTRSLHSGHQAPLRNHNSGLTSRVGRQPAPRGQKTESASHLMARSVYGGEGWTGRVGLVLVNTDHGG